MDLPKSGIQNHLAPAQTLSLTEDEFELLKFELRQFRKRWAKDVGVARKNLKGDRVFQLNIQLFALTNVAVKTTTAE